MDPQIKSIEFLDLSDQPKKNITTFRDSSSDNRKPGSVRRVLVQTEHARELGFYVFLEVLGERDGKWVGRVLGQEDYHGPREIIYPGPRFQFEFDDMAADDQVWFEERNVANVF
jgi:hypothetical protein